MADRADAAVIIAAAAPASQTPERPLAELQSELQELRRVLAQSRADMTALHTNQADGRTIPAAYDELGGIAAATERATDEILGACEALGAVPVDQHAIPAAQVQAAATRIFEACGFQDLVGQRIGKVVRSLQALDARMGIILARLCLVEGALAPANAPEPGVMNGPQAAIGQSDIDRLLAGG